MKLVFVSAHPAPYRDPFLRRLVKCRLVETKVFSLYDDDNAHAFWNLEAHGYEAEVLGVRGTHWLRMFWRLLRRIICGHYDVICWPGFHRPETKLAMLVSAVLGQSYGFCADSVTQPRRGGLTLLMKRFIIRRAKFIFVPGKAGRDFFVREFHYPVDRICLGQYALEGEEIERRILALRAGADSRMGPLNSHVAGTKSEQILEIRKRYGLGADDVVFLMVANMLKTRHYPLTAAAFCRFAAEIGESAVAAGGQCPRLRFVMVGNGPDQEQMVAMARDHAELVVVPGVSFAEMQDLYAAADVYIHGGTEPASTALVIGALAHLPVMSSPAVGCTADVVRHGETGVLVRDYLSESDWVTAFRQMWDQRPEWPEYGDRARELSRAIDCVNVVDSFVAHIG